MKRFGLRLLTALWPHCCLSGFHPPEVLRLDEQMIRDAMREEMLDQIAQKSRSGEQARLFKERSGTIRKTAAVMIQYG